MTNSTDSAATPARTASAPQGLPGPTGEIDLTFAPRGGRTILTRQYHRGALRVIRPLHLSGDDEATLTVLNPGGGYVGGDTYDQAFTLEAGAQVVLTTQAATRVYRTPQGEACQETRLRLAEEACLAYVPDELIGYAGARYTQRTMAELHESATLFARDVVTPGWSPQGEPFRYERLRTVFDIRDLGSPSAAGTDPPGRLRVRDNLVLEPGTHGLLDAHGPLGPGATHVGSLIVASPHAAEATTDDVRTLLAAAEAAHPGLRTGVTALPRPGLMIRALGTSTGSIERTLTAVIDHLRAAWFGRESLPRRRY